MRARGCSECITGTISVRPSAILSEPHSGGSRLKLQPAVRPTDSDCRTSSLQNRVKACSKILFSLVSRTFIMGVNLFRMRAKTSEFLKVLNRAKIEEESKKKPGNRGGKSPFI